MYTKLDRYTEMELRELRSPLTSREAAGVLGKSLHWVQQHTKAGDVPAVKVGRTYRYDKAAIFELAGIKMEASTNG